MPFPIRPRSQQRARLFGHSKKRVTSVTRSKGSDTSIRPWCRRRRLRRSALAHVVSTFFGGSPSQLMATLLEGSTANVTDDELRRLEEMIRRAKQEKKK